jgi:hypothetical protein
MQKELIERSGRKPEDWIDKFAEPFRELIKEKPEIPKLYFTEPEEVKKYIYRFLN